MGYNTRFTGELKFKNELTASQLSKIKGFIGEDCREHPEWNGNGLYYVKLVFLDDFSGVKWDENSESTYDLPEIVNMITTNMRLLWPDFSFEGKLSAQGEDADDRWTLVINDDGMAEEVRMEIEDGIIECPHCHEMINLHGGN